MNKFKAMCWKFKKLFSFVFYLFPVNKKKIAVYNFNGLGFGDNPRYLVEELLKENKYKIIWIVKDKNAKFPDGVKKVKYKSLSSLFHMITARLWLDTSRYSPRPVFKRKNQFYIQMWHGGIPLKGMEKDAEETLSKGYIECAKKDSAIADFMLSNCKKRTEIIERAFWFDGKILEFGVPRDDILFNPRKSDVDEFKKKYGLENKKIALYAPTFREDRNFYNHLNLDLSKVKEALSKKFNSDFEICIKLHPNDADLKDLPIFRGVINLTSESDSQMILSAVDVVISDYSSMLLDFTLTKRFAITFAPDFEQYKSKERHLYFDLETCGIPFALNEEELLKIINDFDSATYEKNIRKFLDYFGIFEKGDSSYLIKKYLIENGILK